MRNLFKEGDLLTCEVQQVQRDGALILHTRTKKNSRKELVLDTMCDVTSFQSIVQSNHVCSLFLANKNNGVRETHEKEMRSINALENEGAKIRYKVVLAMFKLNTDLYNPVSKELPCILCSSDIR